MSTAESELTQLIQYLDQPVSVFPKIKLEVLLGKIIFKNKFWLKAILLCKDKRGALQIRFYTWQKVNDEYKVRQKFSLNLGQLSELAPLLNNINVIFGREAERKYFAELEQQKQAELLKIQQLKAQLFEHQRFVKSEEKS